MAIRDDLLLKYLALKNPSHFDDGGIPEGFSLQELANIGKLESLTSNGPSTPATQRTEGDTPVLDNEDLYEEPFTRAIKPKPIIPDKMSTPISKEDSIKPTSNISESLIDTERKAAKEKYEDLLSQLKQDRESAKLSDAIQSFTNIFTKSGKKPYVLREPNAVEGLSKYGTQDLEDAKKAYLGLIDAKKSGPSEKFFGPNGELLYPGPDGKLRTGAGQVVEKAKLFSEFDPKAQQSILESKDRIAHRNFMEMLTKERMGDKDIKISEGKEQFKLKRLSDMSKAINEAKASGRTVIGRAANRKADMELAEVLLTQYLPRDDSGKIIEPKSEKEMVAYLDKLSPQQAFEVYRAFDRTISGAQATKYGTSHLDPNTVQQMIANARQRLLNKKSDAKAGEFLHTIQNSFKNEKVKLDEQVKHSKENDLSGFTDLADDEGAKVVLKQHGFSPNYLKDLKENLNKEEEKKESINPERQIKVEKAAKALGISIEEADKRLKALGR